MTKPERELLTKRERDVLTALSQTGYDWNRLLDIGGSNGSDHSRIVRKLAARGFVAMKVTGGSMTQQRRTYRYGITVLGQMQLESQRV